ncbi:MAG: ATP-dependent DNA helicase, partial [Coriobacteriales bacterium]|nr:ATP-dependent DNA helicase [Coriobacteriales bacterium]
IKLDAQDQTLCFVPREDIARCFQPDSMLSAMYPGFEPRAEQVEMACEVQRAFSTDGISAIEAGTGVRKSMAYLLPAALLAQGNGIGVGVATKTNALMDQLIYNELPRLAKQLPQGLRYVAIKGYEHYPCLRKMQAMASMDPEPSEDEDGKRRDLARITLLASIYAFLDQSAWADFDAIPLHWSDLPRKAICASSGDCLHNRCRFFPQFCLIHGLRQMARCADIVVTNHALLFRDAASEGALLPPIRHWIVDEAHAVEDEARKQLSLCADVRDLRGELAHLAKGPSSVMAHAIRKAKQVEGGQLITICAVKVEEEANRCDAIAESFFSFVKDLAEHAEKSSYDVVELWVNEQLRETGTWSVVAGTGRSLANHLTTLTDLCKELLSCIDSQESRLWDVAADVKGSCCHLEEARDAVDLCVNVQDPDYVYSASLNRRPDVPAEALNASLLDVGNALNQLFYPRVQSVVYTSATIATGESFEHFNHAVGLDLQEAGRCRSLKLSSSYDFQRNMTVLLPYDMPDPTCGKLYTEALCDLLLDVHEAMGGSTLTLFTNRKEMEHVYNAIHPRLSELGIPLLCQSKGYSAKRLRDEFLANKQTSLFALKSFWEGFDAPGDTLRCVVIPKLPFARPTDPLYLERELRERNAWQRYSLPEAILDLKQAAGRLIRSSTDRGVLLLCDSRLLTKFYGARFLGSLPSQNQLRLSVDDVGAFLRSWE